MYRQLRAIINNNDGYTFIESLFQMIVYVFFAQLFLLLILWTASFEGTALAKEHTEWELFINDLNTIISKGNNVEILGNGEGIRVFQPKEIVDTENVEDTMDVVDIVKYNEMIRKRINGVGHEPMLMETRKVKFFVNYDKLIVQVEFFTGLKKEREIYVPILKE